MAETRMPTDEELSAAGVRLEIAGAVATVSLARPERRNAMTGRTWTALAHIGHALPESVRIVVVKGDGPSFSAGIDLAMFAPEGVEGERSLMRDLLDGDPDHSKLADTIAGYQEGFLWLRDPGIVSVAAVRGHAIGAGFQLALSCDLRVLADDARLCMKEPALGLVPDLTGTKPLVETVGVSRAIELCLTAREVPAEEARELRLTEAVVEGAALDETVDDLVAGLLDTPAEAATATKELLRRAPGNTLEEQAEAERRAQVARLAALARGGNG